VRSPSYAQGDVSRALALSLGIPALALSALASLLLGYTLFLLFASGGPGDGTHPLLAPVGLMTFGISCINLVNAARFMAERRWRFFVYFLVLSVAALALLTLLWNAGE
jgi:O-antigen/teichoic acid export membrane protein